MYLKKISTGLVLVFLTAYLQAQEKFAELSLSPEQLVTRDVKLLVDNKGNLLADVICFAGDSRALLNHEEPAKIIYQESKEGNNSFQKVRNFERLATQAADNIFYDCYYSKKNNTIFFTELNSSNGAGFVTDTLVLRPKEHIADMMQYNGFVYFLSFIEKSDIIYLHVKKPGNKVLSVEKRIEGNKNYVSKKKKAPVFSDFFRKQKEDYYIVYDNTHPNPALLSAMKRKIYHLPGKLVFSYDNPDYQTDLITLKLDDFTVAYNSVAAPFPFSEKNSPMPGGSVLSNDILFKTGASDEMFFITATNVYTGKEHFNYVINTGNADSVFATSFFNNAEYDTLTARKKKFLGKYLEFSTIGIANDNDLYNIEISSYYEVMTGWDIFFSVAATVASTYFINTLPNTWGYAFFSFSHKGTFTINNSFNVNTGNFVRNDSAKIAEAEWEQRLEAAHNFAGEFVYREDKATMVVSGKNIYVYLIEPAQEKLLVYKF